MPPQEQHDPGRRLPPIDDSLVINTLRTEIERRQSEEKAEEKEYKRRQLGFNLLMVWFTALLFFTSAFSDFLMWRYVSLTKQSADAATQAAQVASDTLKYMKVSSAETSEQSQHLVTATSNLVLAAHAQAKSMNELAKAQLAQAKATSAVAVESKRSTDIADKSLSIQSRPWMGVAGEPTVTAIVPLESGALQITFQFTMKNIGLQPAFFVGKSATVTRAPDPQHISDFDKVANETCGLAAGMTRLPISFPAPVLTLQAMDADWRSRGGVTGPMMFPAESFIVTDAGRLQSTAEEIVAVGCIAYSDQLGHAHQTRFCFGHFTVIPVTVGEHLRTCIYGNRAD